MPRVGPLLDEALKKVSGTARTNRFESVVESPHGSAVVRANPSTSAKTLQVSSSNADPQGLGLGTAAYLHAAKRAAEAGQDFLSDSQVSIDAARVWEGLERRGFPIERNPKAKAIQDADGNLLGFVIDANPGGSNNWVFRIRAKDLTPALLGALGAALALGSDDPADIVDFDD